MSAKRSLLLRKRGHKRVQGVTLRHVQVSALRKAFSVKKLFFSQRILDGLIDEGKIRLDNNIITILSQNNPSFELRAAYRFAKTADNGPDPHHLVGQIRYEHEIKAMPAEIYLDSIIYQDTAYVAEPGYIGEKKELIDTLSDTDLLARFLLETLL
jgi:hypothetical protein